MEPGSDSGRLGDRTPAHCVNESRKRRRVIERVRVDDVGQTLSRRDGVADFKLPHDRQLFAEAVLVEGLKVDDVTELCLRLVCRTSWKSLLLDICDRPR